ncbi:hypothetical protein ABLV49_10530 [Polaromonas hydrogenivorans]|uniref:Uncharacterized protein n=1 Tax=Polaromonas hydrogenivorans TaxID=335476 RepID=A0AAU7LL77_9BURK
MHQLRPSTTASSCDCVHGGEPKRSRHAAGFIESPCFTPALEPDHGAYVGAMISSTDMRAGRHARQDAADAMPGEGFVLLVMGLTGTNAFAVKVDGIKVGGGAAA